METIIVLVVVAIIVFWIVSIYNKLVTLRNRFKNAFSQIEVQLKRRYDLIPNLVETAKAYMSHERGTLEAVIAARNQAMAGLQAAAADPTNEVYNDLIQIKLLYSLGIPIFKRLKNILFMFTIMIYNITNRMPCEALL